MQECGCRMREGVCVWKGGGASEEKHIGSIVALRSVSFLNNL